MNNEQWYDIFLLNIKKIFLLIVCMFFVIILLLVNIGLTNKTTTNQAKYIENIDKKYAENESDIKQINSSSYVTTRQAINKIYPVGSIYMSINDVDPNIIIGGKWERWGSGKAIVGVNESETEFDTVEKTGGEKTVTLTAEQLPSHAHAFNATTSTTGAHTHSASGTTSTVANHTHNFSVTKRVINFKSGSSYCIVDATTHTALSTKTTTDAGTHNHTASGTTSSSGGHTHTVNGETSSIGSGEAHNNLQPYMTCYMWKRIE